jgi:hypothetical protein
MSWMLTGRKFRAEEIAEILGMLESRTNRVF